MNQKNGATWDSRALERVRKALKEQTIKVKLGVLEDKSSRPSGTQSNADIGMRHEFGVGVPQRSWLRVPIADHFSKYCEKAGIKLEGGVTAMAHDGNGEQLARMLGLIGEQVVRDGFATGGFGKWQKHAPGYENNTGQILVDTQQLRNSVSSRVVK